jgi:hypothetical protein
MYAKLLLLLLALSLAAARPAAAQTQGDTIALGRAVASMLADSFFLPSRDLKPAVWERSRDPLDSTVAAILLADSARLRLRTTGNSFAFHVSLDRVSFSSDTALVTIKAWQQLSRREGINGYIHETNYVFAREGTGWRFVRRERPRIYDTGSVRG